MSFTESIQAENKRLEQEAEKFKQENDLPGFWVPEKGENKFKVLEKEVREKDFGQGARKIFSVEVNGETKDWALNPKNPIYRQLIKKLAEGTKEFVMLRTGQDQNTRYEFLEKKASSSVESKEATPTPST